MPGTVLGPGDTAVNNTDKKPHLHGGCIPTGRETNKMSRFCSVLEGVIH